MTALRVIVAERKSRAGDAVEDSRFRRQENKNIRTAEAAGHVIIARVADTVSSQSMPWKRRNLKSWFTNRAKVELWDAVLISEVSRISRGDSDTWFEIETWCRANGKFILDADGLMWPSADDEEWDKKRRAGRDYWESVRDSHAEAKADRRAAGAADGRPPYGYTTAPRADGYKQFVADPVTSVLAVEAFKRIAAGDTAASVTRYLSEQTGQPWRIKRVLDMIRRPSYLGERDGHTYDLLPGLTVELIEQANSVLDARSQPRHTGGRIVEDSFSGCVFCANCSAPLYRHQTTHNGKPTGKVKYFCARGRVGASAEPKCGMPPLLADQVNSQLDVAMRELHPSVREVIIVTSGGDYSKQSEIKRLNRQLATATAAGDMTRVIELATAITTAQGKPDKPLEVSRLSGRSYSELWCEADHGGRRSLLQRGGLRMVADTSSVHVDFNNLNDNDDDVVSVG